jgi:hypothetical protein
MASTLACNTTSDTGLIDLHPKGWVRTKKRNPVVPAIEEFKPFLEQWAAQGRADRRQPQGGLADHPARSGASTGG